MRANAFNFNSGEPKKVVDVSYRVVDSGRTTPSSNYKGSKARDAYQEAQSIQVNLGSDSFEYAINFNDAQERKPAFNERRAQAAYGNSELRTKLKETRDTITNSRDTYNAGRSFPHDRPGTNTLAMA